MPISPAYEWSETPTTVTVTAQCRGATSASTDVFSSPHYVSANAPPFFIELDLHGAIDSTRSVATVRQGVVVLKLTKAQEGVWGRLIIDMPRAERLKRRAASRALAEAEAQAALERKKRAAWDDSRYTLGKQMDKDRAARDRIDSLKAEELKAERERLANWAEDVDPDEGSRRRAKPIRSKLEIERDHLKAQPIFNKEAAAASAAADEPAIVDITDEAPALNADELFQPVSNAIFDDDDEEEAAAATGAPATVIGAQGATGKRHPRLPPAPPPQRAPAKVSAEKKAAAEAAKAALPPVRGTNKIKIGFTKQLLTAPARTKTNNAEFDLPLDPLTAPDLFKSKGLEGDISQRDPAWLKDRGDRFFRMGDHRSAEEAYSMSLKQFDGGIMGQAIDCVVACWSNRAACRLQRKAFLEAATDCGHAISTMCKARCVTENPKTEQAHTRCRMRLHVRRGIAYANAGVLHRALTELKIALRLCDGNMPSDAADRQMLQSDLQALSERHETMLGQLTKADELLAANQQAAIASGPLAGSSPTAALKEARTLYDEVLELVPLEVAALANRAACLLYLGEPHGCAKDCTAALAELDDEVQRTKEHESEHTGMFAEPVPPAEDTALTTDLKERADKLRFELLRRRAAARIEEGETFYAQAAADLKECLKLRPADAATVRSLDELSRRAAAAGVELEPLPPAMPSQLALQDGSGEQADAAADDDDDDDDADGAQDGATPAEGEAAAAGEADAAKPAATGSKPPTGTRSASALKGDADGAFKEARLGKAITLYGKALKADSQAEWFGEGLGLLFRCQCLANRSACHLKMHAFADTVEDAGAAIAALSVMTRGAQASEAEALLLKLLARRGMALCQLTRYDEAAADYAKAVDLDPDNAQLKKDLQLIEAARGAGTVE